MVLAFIDNETAKSTLIKGNSSVTSLNVITHRTWEMFRERELRAWIEWVTSEDNPMTKRRGET
eukprot:1981635-Pyramimonas_sp.AAC.1